MKVFEGKEKKGIFVYIDKGFMEFESVQYLKVKVGSGNLLREQYDVCEDKFGFNWCIDIIGI